MFGYPGGAVLPIYDISIPPTSHVLVRHEQGDWRKRYAGRRQAAVAWQLPARRYQPRDRHRQCLHGLDSRRFLPETCDGRHRQRRVSRGRHHRYYLPTNTTVGERRT